MTDNKLKGLYIPELKHKKVYTQEYVNKLEQENAELKEQYAKECEDVCYVVTNYNKQLTKAKEIIKTILTMDLFQIAENDKDYEIIEQAEQFLKEIEK